MKGQANKYWINIICNEKSEPYLVIVTDGEWTDEIKVTNTKLERLKRSLKDMYHPVGMLVSIIKEDEKK